VCVSEYEYKRDSERKRGGREVEKMKIAVLL
jgi:hypothetical protein